MTAPRSLTDPSSPDEERPTPEPVLDEVLEAARRRLRRMGARPARRGLDLDDLVQDTAAALLAEGRPRSGLLWASVASNKVRDALRAVGRRPFEDLGEQPMDELPGRASEPAGHGDDWAGLCRRAARLGEHARRVLVMRQGLGLGWRTIAFVEAREAEAARSVYYRGREGLRPRSSDLGESPRGRGSARPR